MNSPTPPPFTVPSSPPSSLNGHNISFLLSAFKNEADFWDGNVKTINKVTTGVSGVGLRMSDFGVLGLFSIGEMHSLYEYIRQKIGTLSGEGAIEFGIIASNLLKTRQVYQNAEDQNAQNAQNANG